MGAWTTDAELYDGYWLFLEPLSAGKHELRFGSGTWHIALSVTVIPRPKWQSRASETLGPAVGFDAAMGGPLGSGQVDPVHDSGDGIHSNDEGHAAVAGVARAVPLGLLAGG